MFGHVASHNTRGKEQGRSMRRHGYGISVFGAIVLCCLFFCFPAQSDDNAVSIRVGYYEDGDYMSRGRSAEYIGFNIEFLQKLAKVGGMRYEMLDEGSWENAWHQLLEGHIDMLPAVFRTEEREKEVLFSNLPWVRFTLPSMSELTTNGTVTKISAPFKGCGSASSGAAATESVSCVIARSSASNRSSFPMPRRRRY